ncbi:MAG: 3-oxoacyl-ACP reductase FabG [Actinobacteria bacterium]|nr:3-oxoacyl-ACP reductase FabG [Actinomycetota bacterium]
MGDYFRVALVTGASRGIGAAIACDLALKGYAVALNYKKSREPACNLVDAINASGGRALAVQADVGDSSEVGEMVGEIEKRFGGPDILVNNAGIVRDSLVQNMAEEDWDEVMGTNLKGVFNCSKAVLKTMKRKRWGRIISISSIVGQQGRKGQANYAAAKAGVIAFSKSLALELAPWQITVNVVAPGFTETGMTGGLTERARAGILDRIPLRRACRPEEIAGMVSYLTSKEAGYISGQVFNVDCRAV